ncbi:hypothetical protein KIPB_009257 [Kipferlia bialata]|uniref:Uncharacterized protein n=1 Tax=Kipferlia bialata TaxID=797122 RepID=A0A9K3GM54_9EUKA|nr:hypothetical protein KIPB_009257 [Kipferlia bialata]|eukprot:g9257.t1
MTQEDMQCAVCKQPVVFGLFCHTAGAECRAKSMHYTCARTYMRTATNCPSCREEIPEEIVDLVTTLFRSREIAANKEDVEARDRALEHARRQREREDEGSEQEMEEESAENLI